ncbi:MAG: O-antigen ligase family protein [Bacteroidota bacterium]
MEKIQLLLRQSTTTVYHFGLFLLVLSLPFSNFLMSISQIILFGAWLLDGKIKEKIKKFLKNRTALVISSIFLLHLLGLIYTQDFVYGCEDVRKKIPLFLLPLLFSTSATLSEKNFRCLLRLFVLSVLITSGICFVVLLGWTNKQIIIPQNASIFISHIRFSLMICISVFLLAYFISREKKILTKLFFGLLILWFIAFLIMMQSATGIICMIVTLFVLLIYFILRIKNIVPKISLLLMLFVFLFCVVKVFLYPLKTNTTISENGYYTWTNVCEKELAEEWNNRSKLNFYTKDLRGNDIKYTLIRFLTSKGLNKNAKGISALSDEEINAIEKGIANVNYMGIFNPKARVMEIIWEFNIYLQGGNPSGHSVVQRIELWKASIGIIKENFFFGVGTGDVEDAFSEQYKKINSPLTKEFHLRSHNQFLAIGTAFGLFGIIWFLLTLFYPLFVKKKWMDYFYITFFIIAILSMFTEDTLETQAGVTFFAFFNCLFLFARKEN